MVAIIELVKTFVYAQVYLNDVNLYFVQLEQAQELEMQILAVDSFLVPTVMAWHQSCSGRT